MSKKIADPEPINEEVIEEGFIKDEMITKEVLPEKNMSEPMVYVGPSFLGVTQYTVFINGVSAPLQQAIAEMPAIGCLVVPVKQLSNAMQSIATKQGAIAIHYEQALQYKPKKGE